MHEFEKKIIKELEPQKTDLSIIKELEQIMKKDKIQAKVILGGSLAQQTNIKGDSDIDLFIQFKEPKNISQKLEQIIKKTKKPYQKIKGSRDYYQIKQQNTTIELVPVLEITNSKQAQTIVDVSPLHVAYFNKHANQEIREQIRLVKKFCKSNHVYGAESHIKGLSGHTINLLMLKYKTFQEFIKQAAKWKDKTIIDLEKHHKDPLMVLNESKTQSPLIIIDPVQKNRNAAAALSLEKFEDIKKIAQKYQKEPSQKYFQEQPIPKAQITITITMKQGKKDVEGNKIIKIANHITRELKKHEFEPINKNYFKQNIAYININTKHKELPKTQTIKGPKTDMGQAYIQKFKEKYKNTQIKNETYTATIKRKYQKPITLIKKILESKKIKETVKEIKIHEE